MHYGMGRRHNGAYEHTTAWAVGHRRSHSTARYAAVLQHARRHDPSTRRCLLAHAGIGRRISQLALTRRRSRLSAPLRGHCKQHGIGCRHDGADEHPTE